MAKNKKESKIDEFAFYAGQLIHPLSGHKKACAGLAILNLASIFILVDLEIIQNGLMVANIIFSGGYFLQRAAHCAQRWAQMRGYFRPKGLLRFDRQISVAANTMIASGQGFLIEQFTRHPDDLMQIMRGRNALMVSGMIAAAAAICCGNRLLKGLNLIEGEIGGFKNLIKYRSDRPMPVNELQL